MNGDEQKVLALRVEAFENQVVVDDFRYFVKAEGLDAVRPFWILVEKVGSFRVQQDCKLIFDGDQNTMVQKQIYDLVRLWSDWNSDAKKVFDSILKRESVSKISPFEGLNENELIQKHIVEQVGCDVIHLDAQVVHSFMSFTGREDTIIESRAFLRKVLDEGNLQDSCRS